MRSDSAALIVIPHVLQQRAGQSRHAYLCASLPCGEGTMSFNPRRANAESLITIPQRRRQWYTRGMGFTRVNEFVANEGCEEELTALLADVMHYLVRQPGCNGAELLISDEDESRLLVIERWQDKEAHHQALVNFPKDRLAAARQYFARPPRGEFFVNVGMTRGEVH